MLCPDPDCTAIHLISYDGDHEVITVTPIKVESLPAVIKVMQDHLYAVAAMQDKEGTDE